MCHSKHTPCLSLSLSPSLCPFSGCYRSTVYILFYIVTFHLSPLWALHKPSLSHSSENKTTWNISTRAHTLWADLPLFYLTADQLCHLPCAHVCAGATASQAQWMELLRLFLGERQREKRTIMSRDRSGWVLILYYKD